MLIHGLWMTPLSWEHSVQRYRKRSYNVLAPAWPGLDVGPDQLRSDPSPIEHLGIEEIVDHYDGIIRGLDAPPIIIGHSFGGAFCEQLKSAFPVLKNPANNHRAVQLSAEEFHYGFTNAMCEDESLAAYERYAVPGPGRVLFQGAFANFNPHAAINIDFANDDRAPLLLIAGELDHTVPAVVDHSAFKHYDKSRAVTDYKEFPGGSHFIIGQQGWEEVADYAIDWAEGQLESQGAR